jgi:purine-binding chemotaxis protein CheW
MSLEQTREILKSRARVLARPLGNQQAGEATIEVVEFRLAHERYAIEQGAVREVYPLKDLTPLPCTPAFVPGIMNLRGQILPVIDIKKFFDIPEIGITDLHQVIIVHGGEIELGILADAVAGVRSIALSAIQRSLPTLTGIREEYLKGVTNEAVVILDITKILTDPKLTVMDEVAG